MKTITELFESIGKCEITAVETVDTDQGKIINVSVQPMVCGEVLWMTVTLPEEVREQFDLTVGLDFSPLTRHLQVEATGQDR